VINLILSTNTQNSNNCTFTKTDIQTFIVFDIIIVLLISIYSNNGFMIFTNIINSFEINVNIFKIPSEANKK